MTDWRPGLPSEPCVCDVRSRALNVETGGLEWVVWRNVEVTAVRFRDGGHAVRACRVPGFLGMVPMNDEGRVAWRPIPIPEFAP